MAGTEIFGGAAALSAGIWGRTLARYQLSAAVRAPGRERSVR